MKKRRVLIVIILTTVLLLFIGCAVENTETAAMSAPNPIENFSMEIADTSDEKRPLGWASNGWGENTAVFAYLDEGYSGNRSVKVEVDDYEDGDAKWFFDPVKLVPGDYLFSHYYRSSTDTRFVAAVTTKAGDIEYIDMPTAPASEVWTKYEASFIMSENADAVTVYHLLTSDGYLITDDYSIKPYKAEGFKRGLLTITFDDGWEENTQTALPIMQQFGFKSNQFYATTYIENPRVPNPKELIQLFIDDGHEIGSHSITHPYLTEISNEQVIAELAESKSFLENYLGVSIEYFATPYGAYNAFVKDSIMTYYDAHRTAVEFGYNSYDNLDVSRLKCRGIQSSTTAEQIAKWVKKANDEKLWLILLYHRIGKDPNEYDTTTEMFLEHMQVIKDAGISVVTLSKALAEIERQ